MVGRGHSRVLVRAGLPILLEADNRFFRIGVVHGQDWLEDRGKVGPSSLAVVDRPVGARAVVEGRSRLVGGIAAASGMPVIACCYSDASGRAMDRRLGGRTPWRWSRRGSIVSEGQCKVYMVTMVVTMGPVTHRNEDNHHEPGEYGPCPTTP